MRRAAPLPVGCHSGSVGSAVGTWRASLFHEGRQKIAVDGEIGIRAATLPAFHGDQADRFIVATALDGHLLVTPDGKVLNWRGNLRRLDTRK